jgi:hypothetical protein
MSGLDRITSSAPERKKIAMGQNEVTGSYYPLDSHEAMNREYGKNVAKREFGDSSVMRIEKDDPLCSYLKPDVRSSSSMVQNASHARGFATLMGAAWEANTKIFVLGVANSYYHPVRNQTTQLQDYLYQTTVSNRLNGQFHSFPTSVEIGDPLELYYPSKQDVLDNAIDWCPESAANGRIRDLPMIRPVRNMATQNTDMQTLFERAAQNALERCEIFRDMKKKSLGNNLTIDDFEEKLDFDSVQALSNQIVAKCLPEFRAYLMPGDIVNSTTALTAPQRKQLTEKGFTAAYNRQLHHILSNCRTTEEFTGGQQFIFSLQMIINHVLYTDDSKKSGYSKFMSMGRTMAQSGKYIALMGQANIEKSMNMLYGYAMSRGAFRDNIQIYVQPCPRPRHA